MEYFHNIPQHYWSYTGMYKLQYLQISRYCTAYVTPITPPPPPRLDNVDTVPHTSLQILYHYFPLHSVPHLTMQILNHILNYLQIMCYRHLTLDIEPLCHSRCGNTYFPLYIRRLTPHSILNHILPTRYCTTHLTLDTLPPTSLYIPYHTSQQILNHIVPSKYCTTHPTLDNEQHTSLYILYHTSQQILNHIFLYRYCTTHSTLDNEQHFPFQILYHTPHSRYCTTYFPP